MCGSNANDAIFTPLNRITTKMKHIRGIFLGIKPKSKCALYSDDFSGNMNINSCYEEEYDAIILCTGG
jgi:hypothetical protein